MKTTQNIEFKLISMSSLVDEINSKVISGYCVVYLGKYIEEFLIQTSEYDFLRFSAEEFEINDNWEVVTRMQIQKEKLSDFDYKFLSFSDNGFEHPLLSKIVMHDKTRSGHAFSCECGIKLTNTLSGSTLTVLTGGGRHEALTVKANFIEHDFYPECEDDAYSEIALIES